MISAPLSLAVILSFICGATCYVLANKEGGLRAEHLIGGAMFSGIVLSRGGRPCRRHSWGTSRQSSFRQNNG